MLAVYCLIFLFPLVTSYQCYFTSENILYMGECFLLFPCYITQQNLLNDKINWNGNYVIIPSERVI